jgi:hypothetical protein
VDLVDRYDERAEVERPIGTMLLQVFLQLFEFLPDLSIRSLLNIRDYSIIETVSL